MKPGNHSGTGEQEPIALRPVYSADYRTRLRDVTDLALASVPAYRDWVPHDPGPGAEPLARLAALPVLDKARMREWGPEGFCDPRRDLAAALARGEVEIVKTSGSTGDRVSNVWCQAWWNASEAASWQLNAVARSVCGRSRPEAILASPLCVGFRSEDRLLDRPGRTLDRFLFLNERVNPLDWSDAHMDRMIDELNDFQPAVLEAASSYIAHLCRYAARAGRSIRPPGLVVLTYENPSLLHRRQIAETFRAPMASSYGTTEAGYVFMECEHGRLHQNTDSCHVDFVPFATRHGGPALGSLLVTTFRNPYRVLLRFNTGDIGRLAEGPCSCGRRTGLTLASIEGRGTGLTRKAAGGVVTQGAVDRAIAAVPNIETYQLVQEADGACRFTFTGAAGMEVRIREALEGVFGKGMRMVLEPAPAIPPDPPGKFQLCKARVPVDPRECWA